MSLRAYNNYNKSINIKFGYNSFIIVNIIKIFII